MLQVQEPRACSVLRSPCIWRLLFVQPGDLHVPAAAIRPSMAPVRPCITPKQALNTKLVTDCCMLRMCHSFSAACRSHSECNNVLLLRDIMYYRRVADHCIGQCSLCCSSSFRNATYPISERCWAANAWLHRHTGALAVGACLLTFWATATSDPGYITDDNLATHLRLYPFDGLTSKEKDCWTCHRPRPARSKHCPLCNR